MSSYDIAPTPAQSSRSLRRKELFKVARGGVAIGLFISGGFVWGDRTQFRWDTQANERINPRTIAVSLWLGEHGLAKNLVTIYVATDGQHETVELRQAATSCMLPFDVNEAGSDRHIIGLTRAVATDGESLPPEPLLTTAADVTNVLAAVCAENTLFST